MVKLSELDKITGGQWLYQTHQQGDIQYLFTDSRKVFGTPNGIFFAIRGAKHNAHLHLKEVYEKGIRIFIIEEKCTIPGEEANVLFVTDTRKALQQIVAKHRAQFNIPVIGITGSNGKTIVKEWLYQVLTDRQSIVKNPGSYNSQVGVPLSVWAMQTQHTLGIFEAGISQPGEMENLEKVIQPTIGLFTNLGSAHDEGFASREQKLIEKCKLFANADILIYCADQPVTERYVTTLPCKKFSWGVAETNHLILQQKDNTLFVKFGAETNTLLLPFTDAASVENASHVLAVLVLLGTPLGLLQQYLNQLKTIPMRLQLKAGINNSLVVDDSYNNDLGGLAISLNFLQHQKQRKAKHLILSALEQAGTNPTLWIKEVVNLVTSIAVNHVTLIGSSWQQNKELIPGEWPIYPSTENFLNNFNEDQYTNQVVLIKGARSFEFERIAKRLEQKIHGTVLEIDLNALVDNYNYFKSLVKPATKIMVMVKAFGYGSGSIEIANLLQYHRVDYLGVAYADEGVQLRKNNIHVPIMVLNPTPESFETILTYNLEPELYSFKILKEFISFLDGRPAGIHIKIDSGMHRLGFGADQIQEVAKLIRENPHIKVLSIFSHLAGADDPKHDNYSIEQAELFSKAANELTQCLSYKPLYHLLNSPGILRLPQYQYDMVRLGIGLYGVDPTENNSLAIQPIATLKTIVSQVHTLPAGSTVGYGRHGKITEPSTIATIAIGYADGYSRSFSKGVGEVCINGKRARVIGNVCMDMTMVDVTNLDVKEGDSVEIFGKNLPVQEVAEKINTIPYEILTNTSERVKRIFISAGI